MTATTGVGGLIYGRALVDQRTGKKINFDELDGGNIPEDITDLIASSEFENLVAAMSSELATKNDSIYIKQREMKDQVLSASTVEELQRIKIGW